MYLNSLKSWEIFSYFVTDCVSLHFMTPVLHQIHEVSDSDWSFESYLNSENWKFHTWFHIVTVFGYLDDE